MGLFDNIRLDDLSPEDQVRIPLDAVTVLRAEMLPRWATQIEDGPQVRVGDTPPQSCGSALRAWAARMEAATSAPTVTVFRTPLPWLAALAVVRYGEAPYAPHPTQPGQWAWQWPREWSEADVRRALAWESGESVPGAVTGRAIIVPGSRLQVTRATLTSQEA